MIKMHNNSEFQFSRVGEFTEHKWNLLESLLGYDPTNPAMVNYESKSRTTDVSQYTRLIFLSECR